MKKVFLWGYWVQNFGDDLFLNIYLDKIKKYKVQTYILTRKKYKKYYKEMGFNILCMDSLLYKVLYKILIGLHRPELFYLLVGKKSWFIMLGGSLFAENKGEIAENLQLKNLGYAVKRAQKSFVIGSNFGPYRSALFLKKYTELFSQVDDVCFRDRKSFNLFSKTLNNVRFAPDIAFEGEWHQKSSLLKNKVVVSAIDLTTRAELVEYCKVYDQTLSNICIKHIKNGDQVVLVSLCKTEGDTRACSRIRKIVEDELGEVIEIVEYSTINEILELIENAKKVYATRGATLMA